MGTKTKPERIRALEVVEGMCGKVREVGDDAGPMVSVIQRADGLPGEGYAYCMATQQYGQRAATGAKWEVIKGKAQLVGGRWLANGTASVPIFHEWCRQHGYLVTRPRRGDRVMFDWNGDGVWDHVGGVSRTLRLLPGVVYLLTAEGNTGTDAGGPEGVNVRHRIMPRSRVSFARIPDGAGSPAQ